MTPKGTYRVVSCDNEVLWEKADPSEDELREALLQFNGFMLWSPYYYGSNCDEKGGVF